PGRPSTIVCSAQRVSPAVLVRPRADLDPHEFLTQPHGDLAGLTAPDGELATGVLRRSDRGDHRGRAAREHLGEFTRGCALLPLLGRDPALLHGVTEV